MRGLDVLRQRLYTLSLDLTYPRMRALVRTALTVSAEF